MTYRRVGPTRGGASPSMLASLVLLSKHARLGSRG